MEQITIGCDPELFVKDSITNQYVSAWGMIPGTKQHPHKVDHGAIQIDGTALEFNIDPASTRVEFVGNVRRVLNVLKHHVNTGNNNLRIVADPVADYHIDYFKTIPEQALELGCDPDYNAYTGEVNPRPEGDRPFRTASGHIHIGWGSNFDPFSPGHFETCQLVVQQLDFFLGLPALLFDRDGERRRELYGKAGAFRPKPYGVEYRVLSNTWLRSEQLIEYVYDQARSAIQSYQDGIFLPDDWGLNFAKQRIDKNNCDEHLLNRLGMPIPPSLSKVSLASSLIF